MTSSQLYIDCSTVLPNKSIIAYKTWNYNIDSTIYCICVHGWLDNANTYDPLLNIVAKQLKNIKFICIDLPGHGQSSHTSRYDLTSDAAALYNFIDVLLFNNNKQSNDNDNGNNTSNKLTVHLMGHSWGGAVCQLVTSINAQRIQSIILLDSLGPFTLEPDELASSFANAVIQRAQRASKQPRKYKNKDDIVAHYMSGNKFITKKSTEILMERGSIVNNDNTISFIHDVQLQSWYMSMTEELWLQHIKRIECHVTHIMAQNEDRLVFYMSDKARNKFTKNWSSRIQSYKSIKLIRLHNAKHHAHMDMADIVSQHVIDHFNSNQIKRNYNNQQLIAML